jgi:hypothetical protein
MDIFNENRETSLPMITRLGKLNQELISSYKPVTTITAGFPDEKHFTLPVQDAALSGKIKYSSIHPNQSHTEGWVQAGDSISWTLEVMTTGKYRAELQYGCPTENTGSTMMLSAGENTITFSVNQPFESVILPERDFVKRNESVERTWSWMNIGDISFDSGQESIVLKLLSVKSSEAGLVKAVRFVKL